MSCRYPACNKDSRDDVSGYSGKFCSDKHEVKYDHIKADAKDARISEQPEETLEPGREP